MNLRILVALLVVSLPAIAGNLISNADAQWVQTAGPYGGAISSMVTVGANTASPVVFAGTMAGIFRSTDRGAQWVNATAGLNAAVYDLVVMDTEVFAATSSGILRSTDKGRSWRNADYGINGSNVGVLGVMGTTLFASTYYDSYSGTGGILRSTNRGASWITVDTSLPGNNETATMFAALGTELFAGSYDGVFRSSDSGQSWVEDTAGLPSYSSIASLLVMGTHVFVGTNNGIFRSTDSGASWMPASSGVDGDYVRTLVVSGPTLYAGGEYGVFQTKDEGVTWTPDNSGLTNTPVEAIAVLDTAQAGTPATLFAGTYSSGIFESTDGGADWLPANTGLIIANVSAFAVLGPDLFAGTNSSLFLSSDDGGSWQPLSGIQTNEPISILATDGSNLFAATAYSSIYVSADSGMSWITPMNNSGININALYPSNGSLFAGTSAGIFQSPDDGTTWIDASTGLLAEDIAVYSFAQNNSDLYCGTSNGGVFYSADSGSTWNDASLYNVQATGEVSTLAVMKNGASQVLFAGTSGDYSGLGGALYRSTDNGMRWNDTHVNGTVSALLVVGANIFAATDAGISVSSNAGSTWADVSDGMDGVAVNALAIQGAYLFAGTSGSGVWRRPLAEMISNSGVRSNAPRPEREQNYPNPFTTQTTIPFSLSRSGHVTVTIFNAMGNRVATLANQNYGAGPHEVVWNAGAAMPGMYLYRITSADGVESHAIVREK